MNYKNLILPILLVLGVAYPSFSQYQKIASLKKLHVLVYSKNGKGYVHDNIPSAVACIQLLGKTHGFKVDTTSEPSIFREVRWQLNSY